MDAVRSRQLPKDDSAALEAVAPLEKELVSVRAELQKRTAETKRVGAELVFLRKEAGRVAEMETQLQSARDQERAMGERLKEATRLRRKAESGLATVASELDVQKRKGITHARILKRVRDKHDEVAAEVAKSKGRDAVLARLRAQMKSMADEASESRQREAELQTQLSAAKLSAARFEADSFTVKALRDAAESEAEEKRNEVVALQAELQLLSPQLQKLAGDAGGAGAEVLELRETARSVPGLESQLRKARSKVDTLVTKLELAEEGAELAEMAKEQIAKHADESQAALVQLKKDTDVAHAELKAKLTESQRISEAKAADMADIVNERTSELTDLRDELAAVRNRLTRGEQEIEELSKKLKVKTIEAVKSRAEVSTLRKTAETARAEISKFSVKMEERTTSLLAQRQESQAKESELDSLLSANEELQEVVASLRGELEETRLESDEANNAAEQLEAELLEATARLQSYEAASMQSQEQLQSTIEEHDMLGADWTKLEQKLIDAQDERDKTVQEAGSLRKELAAMRMQVLRLQTASATAESAMEKAVANAERFKKDAAKAKAEAADAIDQLQGAWGELADGSAKRLALQTKVGDSTYQLELSQAAALQLEDTVSDLSEKLDFAQRLLAEAQDKNIGLETEVEHFRDQHDRLN
jgi:chromosome segregation ATPase